MIYFKRHFESGNSVCTVYGCYSDNDIQPEGDVLCEVHTVWREDEKDRFEHEVTKEYIEPDEVTFITEKEYLAVINKLQQAEDYYNMADEVQETLI